MSSSDFPTSPLGKSLGDAACSDILAGGRMRCLRKNTILFHENDEASGFFLLLSGRIKLARYTYEGREVILHHVDPSNFFAEAALYLGRYPAFAVSMEDSEVLFFDRETALDLIRRHPAFMYKIFETLSVWLKRMVDKIDQLTLNDATARLVRYLLSLRSEDVSAHPGSTVKVKLPVKKGELATMLNMNQATLSRSLRRLQELRAIAVTGRSFTLQDVAALKRLSLPPLD